MDAWLLKKAVSPSKQVERFSTESRKGAAATIVFCVAWTLLFGIPAAILSWTSNTVVGWHPCFKVVFALVALCNGLLSLLIHLIHKADLLSFIRRNVVGPGTAGNVYRM
jgi:hypothetical protein